MVKRSSVVFRAIRKYIKEIIDTEAIPITDKVLTAA
jgi:hypothetical protein